MLATACAGAAPASLAVCSLHRSPSSPRPGRRPSPIVEVALRARHHRLDGAADRGRQAQDLVDRHRDRRRPIPTPKSAWASSPIATSATNTSPRPSISPPTSRTSTPTCWSCKARGGGDWPESVNEALHVGVTKLAWTQGAGDAPHHVPGRRRAAAHGLRAGHQISRGDAHGARARHHRQRGAGRRRARHRAGVARDRPAGPRPLHPDPAGRRPARDHRDALRHRDHRAAGPHQRHRHPLRPAHAALQRRAEDRQVAAAPRVGRLRDGGLPEQAQRGPLRRGGDRRAAISSPTSRPAGRSSTA